MTNLLIILAILFGSLFLLVTLLEGRAKPMEPEKANQLSRWIMIVVFVGIVAAMLKELFA